MTYISNIILPLITLIVIIYAIYKKVNIYDEFISGVKEGLQMSLEIFPSIFTIIISVTVLVKSNFLNDIISLININIFPKEILPIAILRPISGSASMAVATDIMNSYGVDSRIGQIASIIMGSTETTLYTIAIYPSCINIKKTRGILIAALAGDIIGMIVSICICNDFCVFFEYIFDQQNSMDIELHNAMPPYIFADI